ncbi:hypothetical protein AB0O07_18655 [Streptomyces sp. NPDC093085]|uniref:hypothetical protein n=1 Tax=Streptomyces sp. NPDC093085 TaxID=3155068 RepID=UPI00342A98B1
MAVRQQGHRGAAFAALAVAGVVAGGGCSAPGGAAADDRPAGDPGVVRRAADVLRDAGGARARTSMQMAAGGTRVTIRGEGEYDFGRAMGRLQVLLPKDPAGADEHRPITELLSPGVLYMKNRGAGVPADKWVRVDATTLEDGNLVTNGVTDPLTAAELLRAARDVVLVGERELAGVRVFHYRGVTELGRAAKTASAEVRGALGAAVKGFGADVVPFDAYLDEDGRLRKVSHRFSYRNQGGLVEVASTTLLSGFGARVTVTLPPEDSIFTGEIKP